MKRWMSILLCAALMLSLCSLSAAAASGDAVDELVDGIVQWSLDRSGAADVQEWLDTGLSESAGVGAEWYVLALRELGYELDYSRYAAALQNYVEGNSVANASTRERIALGFIAAGYNSPFINATGHDAIGELGLMSYVYGLHLSNCGADCSLSGEEIVAAILELQLADGGWAISGERGDPDATAMTLQALAPHREHENVAEAVDAGLAYLAAAQLDNGGYRSFGQETPESICQVILALCTLGIDPMSTDYIKNGSTLLDALLRYRLEDGSFCHSAETGSNGLSTVESLYTLAAYRSFLNGGKNLYEFEFPQKDIAEAQRQSEEQSAPTEESVTQPETPGRGRTVLLIAAGALALAACAYFFFSGKRSGKNYLFTALVFALSVYLIFTVRIEKTSDYYSAAAADGPQISTEISIRCDSVRGEREHIPADGVILEKTVIAVSEKSSAYDQLVAACKSRSIHMDKEESAFGSAYVKGLANIYEFDFGDLSGWMFAVNGKFSDVGAGEYILQEGDCVEWVYTRELGRDVGAGIPEK